MFACEQDIAVVAGLNLLSGSRIEMDRTLPGCALAGMAAVSAHGQA